MNKEELNKQEETFPIVALAIFLTGIAVGIGISIVAFTGFNI